MSHIFQKKGLNSQSHIRKKRGSILWVKRESVSILWVILEKKTGFKSVCRIQKGQWCESYPKKSSMMWVIQKKKFIFFFEKKNLRVKAQVFENTLKKVQIIESYSKKGFNSLSMFIKKNPIHWGHMEKKVQFFESYF